MTWVNLKTCQSLRPFGRFLKHHHHHYHHDYRHRYHHYGQKFNYEDLFVWSSRNRTECHKKEINSVELIRSCNGDIFTKWKRNLEFKARDIRRTQWKVKLSLWMPWTRMWIGGIASHILKLVSKLGWVASLTPRSLKSRHPEIIYVREVSCCRRVALLRMMLEQRRTRKSSSVKSK